MNVIVVSIFMFKEAKLRLHLTDRFLGTISRVPDKC